MSRAICCATCTFVCVTWPRTSLFCDRALPNTGWPGPTDVPEGTPVRRNLVFDTNLVQVPRSITRPHQSWDNCDNGCESNGG